MLPTLLSPLSSPPSLRVKVRSGGVLEGVVWASDWFADVHRFAPQLLTGLPTTLPVTGLLTSRPRTGKRTMGTSRASRHVQTRCHPYLKSVGRGD